MTVGQSILFLNHQDCFEIGMQNSHGQISYVFVCPAAARNNFRASNQILFLDCALLKSEAGGVLFYAYVVDGGQEPVLIAFLLTEEENPSSWFLFLSLLEQCGIPAGDSIEGIVIKSLCSLVQNTVPRIETLYPEIVNSDSWWKNGLNGRKKRGLYSTDSSPMRSLLFRSIFDGSKEAINLRLHLSSEYPELEKEMSESGKWARSFYSHPYSDWHSLCTCHMNRLLDQNMLRYLMLDDVVSGLYVLMATQARERLLFYSQHKKSELAPCWKPLIQKYSYAIKQMEVQSLSKSLYIVTEEKQIVFDVDLAHNSCSCGSWAGRAFPCVHCWAVLQRLERTITSEATEYFTCGAAMRMCEVSQVPQFSHSLEQQADYYKQNVNINNEFPPWPEGTTSSEAVPFDSVNEKITVALCVCFFKQITAKSVLCDRRNR